MGENPIRLNWLVRK